MSVYRRKTSVHDDSQSNKDDDRHCEDPPCENSRNDNQGDYYKSEGCFVDTKRRRIMSKNIKGGPMSAVVRAVESSERGQ